MRARHLALSALLATGACSPAAPPSAPFDEKDLAELTADLAGGTSAVDIAKVYLARIEALNPQLKAVISVNPAAMAEAAEADKRKAGDGAGPLNGLPILIKDNIDVRGQVTTAGSLALAENRSERDAPLVERLRASGAVFLGKANLSEWANIRSRWSSSGWSAVGGIARNPYDPARSACGSSSGSGSAVAAGLAPAAIGTETDGSITCPAAANGIVGLKPTIGLVSRTGVVPISHIQDTAGPMTLTVTDAAAILTVIAGSDPADPATKEADARKADYVKALDPQALKGAKLGVMRFLTGNYSPKTLVVFDAALEVLKAQGAEIVEVKEFEFGPISEKELPLMLAELKAGLNAYLATTPASVKTRTLADVIAFNRSEPRETPYFGQDFFEQAEGMADLTDAQYIKGREEVTTRARAEGIDKMLADHGVTALIAPTYGPAWLIDTIVGDNFSGGASSTLPAVAGYPHLTVPMGYVEGMPVGLSFIGTAWSEAHLLSLGLAFEKAAPPRKPPAIHGQAQ
ncbi:MAG: amidase [Rhodospirillaceae bacterium]